MDENDPEALLKELNEMQHKQFEMNVQDLEDSNSENEAQSSKSASAGTSTARASSPNIEMTNEHRDMIQRQIDNPDLFWAKMMEFDLNEQMEEESQVPEVQVTEPEVPNPQSLINRKGILTAGRSYLYEPYLEDVYRKIFINQPIRLKLKYLLGVDKWNKEYRRNYRRFMRMSDLDIGKRKVTSDFNIEKVLNVGTDWRCDYQFATFKIKRNDGEIQEICETDFEDMSFDDIIFLHKYFKDLGSEKDSMDIHCWRAVSRFMRFKMRCYMLMDFQIGLEANQKKINITAPLFLLI